LPIEATMSNQTTPLTPELYRYLLDVSLREPDVLRRLRIHTATLAEAHMQIAPEQGQFMALLVELLGARRVIEIGVFTGYSALAVALALPPDGRLLACDVSEEWTTLARPFWQEAGVTDKIDLRLAPALATLDALLAGGQAGRFDFAFIDADKENTIVYYERLLSLLRSGGLIAVDNVLWNGWVADPRHNEQDTVAIRAFNQHLHADERVSLSVVPIGDGLTLARKR
jgi:caffeoyl-CoA O-methyltransferase